MLNKMRKMDNKGFTLIELMIVIAIIGILAAIAIPNFIAYRNKAYCSGAESDVNAIMSTLSDYYAIPTHTAAIVGNVGPTATDLNGVQFGALSNKNTAVIAGTISALTITVSDVSGRCPTDYMNAQTDAGWTVATHTFRKTM
jgi:prepilin-type N-terminal cleavage/methylation domain-containing protein